MADTNTSTKKFFLDLEGLGTLWSKIKSNFAGKSETETALSNVNTNISNVQKDLESILNMVLAVSPKEVNTYSDAVLAAPDVVPGIAIKVNTAETVNDIVKPAGIYLVENVDPVSLVFVGNADSNISTEELAGIISRIAVLEANAVKYATITDANGTQLGTYNVTDNTLVIVHDDAVDVNSESIHALTHRAVAAKFRDMLDMISVIPRFKISVVDSLPTTAWSLSTIYLVKNSSEQTNNLYTEYIYVENQGWEKLGEQTITLDDYVTKDVLNSTVNEALKDYAKNTDIETLKNEILGIVADIYATKEEISEFMTETDIINSITDGNIGNEIAITEDQINDLS